MCYRKFRPIPLTYPHRSAKLQCACFASYEPTTLTYDPDLIPTSHPKPVSLQDKDMVEHILELRRRLDEMVIMAMQRNEIFVNALKEAFESFINQVASAVM